MRCVLTLPAALLLFAAAFAVAAPALAGPGDAGSGSTPAADRTLVVVADVSANVTDNAQMRAAVFETARKRGYSPAVRTDVDDVALGAGAIDAGRISTAPASLGSLRRALGVGMLVRVSSEWVRGDHTGVRVTLVAEQGTKSEVVDVPTSDPRPDVAKAVGRMLDQLAGTKAKPPPAPAPTPGGSAPAGAPAQPAGGSAGIILPGAPAPGANEPPPLTPRQAWAQRGGVIASYEARVIATGVLIPDRAFTDENPVTKQKENGKATAYGIGGGLGVRFAMLVLPRLDPDLSSGNFTAFSLGVGVDGSVLYMRPAVGYNYRLSGGAVVGRQTAHETRAWLYGNGTAQIGVHFGIGRFRRPTIWRGVVLGLAYSPTWTYRLDIGSLDGEGKLNFAGFEADLDIASLEARRGITSESQIRLSAYVLPRYNSDLPWLASLGLGAVWY